MTNKDIKAGAKTAIVVSRPVDSASLTESSSLVGYASTASAVSFLELGGVTIAIVGAMVSSETFCSNSSSHPYFT